jgi:hypothetical protein
LTVFKERNYGLGTKSPTHRLLGDIYYPFILIFGSLYGLVSPLVLGIVALGICSGLCLVVLVASMGMPFASLSLSTSDL